MYEVNFNKKAYEGKSKAEFIESEKHHEEFGVDLSKEYDKMFPQAGKPEVKATSKTEKTE